MRQGVEPISPELTGLALIACILWIIEAALEGNTAFEVVTGSLMLCLWAAVIVLVDRWVNRGRA
jgi:hypothetical protein